MIIIKNSHQSDCLWISTIIEQVAALHGLMTTFFSTYWYLHFEWEKGGTHHEFTGVGCTAYLDPHSTSWHLLLTIPSNHDTPTIKTLAWKMYLKLLVWTGCVCDLLTPVCFITFDTRASLWFAPLGANLMEQTWWQKHESVYSTAACVGYGDSHAKCVENLLSPIMTWNTLVFSFRRLLIYGSTAPTCTHSWLYDIHHYILLWHVKQVFSNLP